MEDSTMSLDQAFTEVSASSAGGAPFLIAYGATFLISGVLSYLLAEDTAALIAMFQGGVAQLVKLAANPAVEALA